MTIQRLENVAIVVDNLAAATAFFVELGLELLGEGTVEGDWVDRVVGLGALLAGAVAEVIDPGHAVAVLAVVSLLVSGALTRPLTRATQPRPEKPHHPAGTMMTATNARRS